MLAVDDDAASLSAIEATLKRAGYSVFLARGGEAALESLQRVRPDLVLLDIAMPGIDGYEVMRRLSTTGDCNDVPIIVLSSNRDMHDKVRAFDLGAVDYVSKPFRTEELIARVRAHLTIQCLQTSLADQNAALEVHNQRMQADLEAAGRIQRAMLPACTPDRTDFDFAWMVRSCVEVGGDALDLFAINDHTVAFYLLDVSGHGAAACLLAVSLARSLTPRCDRTSIVLEPGFGGDPPQPVPPGEVLRRLNALYPMDPDRNPHFVTMVYGLLDCRSGAVRTASAGHPCPLLLRADGTVSIVQGGSVPLGVQREAIFNETTLELGTGDRLAFYSDGVIEQRNPSGEEFGVRRLASALSDTTRSLAGAVDVGAEAAVAWCRPSTPTDDLSMLAVERRRDSARQSQLARP